MTRWHWLALALVVAGSIALVVQVENLLVGLWLALSIVGAAVSAHLTNESRLDLAVLDKRTNGRRTAAWSRLLREGGRLTVHVGYILAGLTALDLIAADWIIVPALMWSNVVMVSNSLIDARTRRLLRQTRGVEPEIGH